MSHVEQPSVSLDPRLAELVRHTAQMLNKEDVKPESMLSELGIDSLNVVELILICEQIYANVANPDALTFDNFTTLRDLHEQLASQTV